MEPNELLVVAMLASLVLLMLTGFPVAWVLGGLGVLFAGLGWLSDQYLDTITGLDFLSLGLVVNRIYRIMDNWVLVALPMFIYMGIMLDKSGVAERLMLSLQQLFGRLRGGLALSVTLIGILLAAATGIIGASVVLLGLLSLQPMLRRGYDPSLAAGTVAAVGTLGILLPPSIMLVIMADQLSLSVGDLFMGAVFPGLLLGGLYVVFLLLTGWLRPSLMPAGEARPLESGALMRVLGDLLPPLLLVLAVLGSIFAGIATATEASGIGAAGATLLALVNRRLDFGVLTGVLRDSFKTTATIFAIFLGATCYALVLRELGGDELIESLLDGLSFGPLGIIAAVLAMVFLLGFVLDWLEITLIFLPLFGPLIAGLDLDLAAYQGGAGGITDPALLWFLVLTAVVLQTSFLTPPVGFALFYLKGVCPPSIGIGQIYRGVLPFVLLQLVGLALVFAFPGLVLWLPGRVYG